MESVKIQVRRGQVKTGHVRKGDKGGIGADWTDQIRSGQVRSADLEKASSSGSVVTVVAVLVDFLSDIRPFWGNFESNVL